MREPALVLALVNGLEITELIIKERFHLLVGYIHSFQLYRMR